MGVLLATAVPFASKASFARADDAATGPLKFRQAHYTLLGSPDPSLSPGSRILVLPKDFAPGPGGISLTQKLWDHETGAEEPPSLWSGKSYLIPAIEVPAFNLALNGVARLIYPTQTENGKKVFKTDPSSFWDNLIRGHWGIDNDDYVTNQIRHPYQGSIYQGLARSAGLSFWESAGYTFLGSFLWETGGETTPPSINDQVASGVGGVFLGEALFRMASLILEHTRPGFWRELGTAVVSPPTSFNRHAFGSRFKAIFPSRDPAIFWRFQLGPTVNIYTSGAPSSDFEPNEAMVNFLLTYGLPGKPGYSYTRPFDYFEFEITGVGNTVHPLNPVQNVMTRGLLLGRDYEIGGSYRGIWGLYGSYDYVSMPFFRVSTTALSFGTTSQWWLSRSVALQSSALAGAGFGAGGDSPSVGDRDYHYGANGQALLSLRLILGDSAMLEATHREYYISKLGSTPRGSETIGHLNLGATVRIYGPHAVGIHWLFSTRDGEYSDIPDQHHRMARVALLYNLLGHTHFGAVKW